MGPKLVRTIKSIFTEYSSKVQCKEKDSKWFEVRTGVRQKGVISPLLFILFLDQCMSEICINDEN